MVLVLVRRSTLPALWKSLEDERQKVIDIETEAFSQLFHAESLAVAAALPDRGRVLAAIHSFGPRWKATIESLWVRISKQFGSQLFDKLTQKAWNPLGMLKEAARRARTSANAIVATTKRRVGKLLSEVTEAAVDDVDKLYAHWKKVRARFISGNETRAAIGASEENAAKQTRRPLRKTWISMRDAAVRDTHQEYDGTTRHAGGEWAPGLRFPHDPNADVSETAGCRCVVVYN
jgi:hypothetical protein